MNKQPDHQTWQQARLAGIADLHSLTEAAKDLDAVATAQNPDSKHYYYSTFINLIYKELFFIVVNFVLRKKEYDDNKYQRVSQTGC